MAIWSQHLKQRAVRQQLREVLPHKPSSPNAYDPTDVALGYLGGIVCGADELSRIAWLQSDSALTQVLGSEAFRQEYLERMEDQVGDHHPGRERLEIAVAKAQRLIAQELARLHWTAEDLIHRAKSDSLKLALAARLRRETTLSIKEIAARLNLGKPKGAKSNLHKYMSRHPNNSSPPGRHPQ
jgi:hypothetical protein